MSAKFNPNALSFVPSIVTGSTLPQHSNMSSHAAPPTKSKNGNGHASGRKNNKKRESKGQSKQRQQIEPSSALDQSHPFYDELNLDIEDQLMSGNVKTKGRRGQISINHLMDFGLPSRDLVNNTYNKPAIRRSRRRSSNTERISLNGSEFINANYRFVVDHRHGYKGQIMDPNLVLPDSSILRVVVPKGHHCPICLNDEIIAPRMSSCGHIFCHSCLLSFLDSQPIVKKGFPATKYKECPLCSDFVKPDEIKPVLIRDTDERFETPKIGHDVVMKLMARPIGNILPLPHGLNLNHKKVDNIPWYSDLEVYPYARILKGGLKFAVENYEREKAEILQQYEEDKLLYPDSDNGGKYIHKAIEEIDLQLRVLKEDFKENYSEPGEPLSCKGLSLAVDDELHEGNAYFFYQTSFNSTTRYFLSSLDTRIILRMYGNYSNFPSTLLLHVENINSGLMVTETLLKRYKFMNHLPLGTELATLEINWSSMRLPSEVYQEFKKDLSERQRKSKSKARREDLAKKNYESIQELKTLEFYQSEGSLPGTNGLTDTPVFEDIVPIQQHHDTVNLQSVDSGDVVSTVWGTKIPKGAIAPQQDMNDHHDDWDFEEMLKKANGESNENLPAGGNQKKKGKKRMVLLTSSGRGGY